MSDAIISVSNLGKCYKISHERKSHHYVALRDVLAEKAKGLFSIIQKSGKKSSDRAADGSTEDFWAVKDVSFEIHRGDVVGIIGRNGAGKSTLLKILSRITEPTKGRVKLRGRVASLLEVGTGFHPELTGRENIFLNGAILGMPRVEIKRKFDEIVAFAEVDRFLDTPVKRYSSGMYVRLAFAVAAHLEPEILVVDEVLAVGDAQFQKKCLGKMRDVASQEGRTVLFVSHNMAAVLQLTTVGIVLNKGQVIFQGNSEDAVAAYTGATALDSTVAFNVERTPRKHIGTHAAKFLLLRFDRELPIFTFEEDFSFIAKVRAVQNIPRIRFSMTIFTAEGTPVGSCFSSESGGLNQGQEAEIRITLPCPKLAPGRYHCGVAIGKGDNRNGHVDYDAILDTLAFEVRPEEGQDGTIAKWERSWGVMVFSELQQKKLCREETTV
ncbi:MAG TPA: ABC transporter ATP-binding protein [Verrucomicrobiae bacterium]|jgi:lipopolysaccharide transport system ATP-binding protein